MTKSGCTFKVTLENKSSDVTYMYAIDSASINSVDSDPYFADSVAPGKKANDEISFTDDFLTEDDFGVFSDICMTFHVYDYDDWAADDVAEETIHIYPYGEENTAPYVRQVQDTDTVIADNDDVTIIVTGYDPDGFWGYTVNLYLVNKTDSEAMFSADNVSVNGFMVDPYWPPLSPPDAVHTVP